MPRTLKNVKEDVQKLKDEVNREENYDLGLSSGSTLVNLSCSGRSNIAFMRGTVVRMVGITNSGKSVLMLQTLAEASNNSSYDGYQLIYDGNEGGALMDFRKMYGNKFIERVSLPSAKGPSRKIEEFFFNIYKVMEKGPCIYALDSWDGLSSEQTEEHFLDSMNKFNKGEEMPGSYGDGKAKKASQNFPTMMDRLMSTGSILMFISQSRSSFNQFSGGKTCSGGNALHFYSSVEMWSDVQQQLHKSYKGIDVNIGQICRFHIKRTRLTGWAHTIELPILPSCGIDEIGSMVDFLLKWKFFDTTGEEQGEGKRKRKTNIIAPQFNFEGTRDGLIEKIESSNEEQQLRMLVTQTWKDVESACSVDRKKRYV